MVKQISDNEIYLLIKYIKSIIWRVAKCLSYIQDARCLKFNWLGDNETDAVCEQVTSYCHTTYKVPIFDPRTARCNPKLVCQ